jgi:hypothetical protein
MFRLVSKHLFPQRLYCARGYAGNAQPASFSLLTFSVDSVLFHEPLVARMQWQTRVQYVEYARSCEASKERKTNH